MPGVGETGPIPRNARNRQAALAGSPRASAVMEAAMTRRRYAFAHPSAHLVIGAKAARRRHNPDTPVKSL